MRLNEILHNLEETKKDLDMIKNVFKTSFKEEELKDFLSGTKQAVKGLDGMLEAIYKEIKFKGNFEDYDPLTAYIKKPLAIGLKEKQGSYLAKHITILNTISEEIAKYTSKDHKLTHGKVINHSNNSHVKLTTTYNNKAKSALTGARKMQTAAKALLDLFNEREIEKENNK